MSGKKDKKDKKAAEKKAAEEKAEGEKVEAKKKQKQKVTAILVAPFLVALAPGIPPATAEIVKVVVEAKQSIHKPQPPGSDGFIFAGEWASMAHDQQERNHAIELATRVVEIAIAENHARAYQYMPNSRPFVQWILAGGMTQKDAQKSLDPDVAKPKTYSELVREMNKVSPVHIKKAIPPTPPQSHQGRPVVVMSLEPGGAFRKSEPPKLEWMSTAEQSMLHADPEKAPYADIVISPEDSPEPKQLAKSEV